MNKRMHGCHKVFLCSMAKCTVMKLSLGNEYQADFCIWLTLSDKTQLLPLILQSKLVMEGTHVLPKDIKLLSLTQK